MTTFPKIAVYKVSEDFMIYQLYDDCVVPGVTIIPAEFATDFASIPRFLWSVLPPHLTAMPASVLHDFFYTTHPYAEKMTMDEERLFADKLFRDHLIQHGVSKFQAGVMYNAVRLFGKFRFEHFGKSRKRVRLEKKLEKNRIESKSQVSL